MGPRRLASHLRQTDSRRSSRHPPGIGTLQDQARNRQSRSDDGLVMPMSPPTVWRTVPANAIR